MPSLYTYALLAAMALAAGWGWFNEYGNHAADRATYRANLQTADDNLKAAHHANDDLVKARDSAIRSLAVAQALQRTAQESHDRNSHDRDELERTVPAVRAYLDTAMPCDLYRQLRARSGNTDAGGCTDGATPGRVHDAVEAARVAGPDNPLPGRRVGRDRATAR